MEKHWKSVISKSVCDYFFEEHKKIASPIDMPPVLATPHHYLITIYRCNLYFVAACATEGWTNPKLICLILWPFSQAYKIRFLIAVTPLFVLEFLHRVVDTFEDYFGECNESIIKEHYVIIYEVRCWQLCVNPTTWM